jgi:sugar phosphate isomerase/epimerase
MRRGTEKERTVITRRRFVKAASVFGLAAASRAARVDAFTQSDPPAGNHSPSTADPWIGGGMGLSSTSLAVRLGSYGSPAEPLRDNSIAYLEYCHSLGGIGVQMAVKGDLAAFRRRAEDLNMFVEYQYGLPDHTDDLSGFEKSLQDAKAVGATCMRVTSTTHRRYEFFKSMAEYQDWEKRSTLLVEKIVPLAEKQKVILAMENHKDRTADEFAALLKRISSEYYGSLVDFGNNIALCEEPMSVVRKLAPYAKSMHLKDMAVMPYDQGFLLSEVVCGRGFLDVKGMVTLCRRANPKVHINLEMITNHVLKVPVKTDVYWATFPERRATALPAIMKLLDDYASQEMPKTDDLSRDQLLAREEDNNRLCLHWGRDNLAVPWLA